MIKNPRSLIDIKCVDRPMQMHNDVMINKEGTESNDVLCTLISY